MHLKSNTIKNLWPYGFLFAALFLFYKDIFLAKGAWLVADHAEQHFPWAEYLAEHIKRGAFPYWTDQIQSGFPIAAEGQIGAFYLPNLLFYFFFSIEEGYARNIVFHLLLSTFFMFSYLKSLQLGNRSALFGTFVYVFGSTLAGAYYNITSLKVLTWFPAALMIVDRILAKDRWQVGKIIVLGIIFSLQLFVGYLQYAAYAILFTGLYMLLRLFENPAKEFEMGQ